MGPAAHSLHLRDRDPDRLPGRGGSHPLHVGSVLSTRTFTSSGWRVWVSAPCGGGNTPAALAPGKRGGPAGTLGSHIEAWFLYSTASLSISGVCSSTGHPVARRCGDLSVTQCTHSAPYSLLQVLPHVLHVCQPGVCSANAAADAQLAAPLPLLPLVSWAGWGRTGTPQDTPVWGSHGTLTPLCSLQDLVLPGHEPLPGTDVHLLLVLRTGGHADCWPHLQIHRVPRVREAQCGCSVPPGCLSQDAPGCQCGALWPEPWACLMCCWFLQGGEGVG